MAIWTTASRRGRQRRMSAAPNSMSMKQGVPNTTRLAPPALSQADRVDDHAPDRWPVEDADDGGGEVVDMDRLEGLIAATDHRHEERQHGQGAEQRGAAEGALGIDQRRSQDDPVEIGGRQIIVGL